MESPNPLIPSEVKGTEVDDKLLYRVSDVAAALSVSRSKAYELVRAGVLPSVKIDGMRRVRGCDLRAYVDSLVSAA